jgi:hypothetical protein
MLPSHEAIHGPELSTTRVGRSRGWGYRLKAIERRINTTTNTAVNAKSIDSSPIRTGRSTRRTGAMTGSVAA